MPKCDSTYIFEYVMSFFLAFQNDDVTNIVPMTKVSLYETIVVSGVLYMMASIINFNRIHTYC